MRALALLALTACSFDRPADVCDGPCNLYAITPPIVHASPFIMLEGNFEEGSTINFPNGLKGQFDFRGASRGRVPLMDASTGLISVTSPTATTDEVLLRKTSFPIALNPFQLTYGQDDAGRQQPRMHFGYRNGAATAVVGNRLLVIGGEQSPGVPVQSVETAVANADGSISSFTDMETLQLAQGRSFATATRIGRFIYLIGGNFGPLEVDRSYIDENGLPGRFEQSGHTLQEGRVGHATVVIGNWLYVIGGSNPTTGMESDTMERAPIYPNFEIGEFELVSGVKMMTSRAGHGAVVIGDYLYVIGGIHGGVPLNSVERIELSPDGYVSQWEDGGQLAEPVAYHATVLLDNSVYVIGGQGSASVGDLASVEKADIATMKLVFQKETNNTLLLPRKQMASFVLGNHVFLIGGSRFVAPTGDVPAEYIERAGFYGSAQIEGFNVAQTATMQNLTLRTPRCEHASVMIGNKVYVIGGLNMTTRLTSIEEATVQPDGTLGAFIELANNTLTKARTGASVAVFKDYLYVLGGVSTSNMPENTVERARINADGTLGSFQEMAMTLPVPHAYGAAFSTGNYLYVVGGINATYQSIATTQQTFFVGTDLTTWATVGSLPTPRSRFAFAAVGKYVYAVGGHGNTGPVATIDRASFNLGVDVSTYGTLAAWEAAPSDLTRGREAHRMLVLGTNLYALAGRENVGLGVERSMLNPDGTYTAFSVVPGDLIADSARVSYSLVTTGDYVYMIGGCVVGGDVPLSTILVSKAK